MSDDYIKHIGTKRHSGRYEWGSGDDSFLNKYQSLKAQKLSPKEIAEKMNLNSTQLRTNITWAKKEQREKLAADIAKAYESGMNKTEIAALTGASEGTVRNYLSNKYDHKGKQLDNTYKALVKGVEQTGYLDVGVGVEGQIGVPRTRFNAVVNKMVQEDGYYTHEIYVERLANPLKPTTVKVLTKEPDVYKVKAHEADIRPLDSWSTDKGDTINNINPPVAIHPKRVKIRYKEDGGEGKDGVIELKPGVEDLDMGSNHYAQVRIKVGENRFLKGMAVNGDPKDFPPGVDIIFNTNKGKEVPFDDVLKKTKDDADNIFGSSIMHQNKTNTLNIVYQEGEWDTWSTGLSSQFLSKQPTKLIKDRLDATHKDLKAELDEILSLNNPVVKQHLLDDYSEGLDSKAGKLKAKGLPNTKSHVILPFPDMNPNEIYAPRYADGTRVVLIRYPHGGTFEIPEVTINNKHAGAKKLMGNAPDAIGMHPSVAKKLSGADFDGDTVYVIPNNDPSRKIVTTRAVKELKNFDPMDYKVDYKTITPAYKEKQMGIVSNLITDMTIRGAEPQEIAKAVRHSMVVIDSEKHNLNYKQSAIDNGISALKQRYQSHINPVTGRKSVGASTLISRSKKMVEDLTKQKKTITDPDFDPDKLSSGTAQETLYVGYIKQLQTLKRIADKNSSQIIPPKRSVEAAKIYKNEVDSLDEKLTIAKSNAPRERQAQILSNKLYYSNITSEMGKDDLKKLKSRSLARARVTTGAEGKKVRIEVTDKEWEAIQNRAIGSTKLKEVLRYADMEVIRKLATPRIPKLTSAKLQKAQLLLSKGKTYAEVSQAIGVTITSAALKEAKEGS